MKDSSSQMVGKAAGSEEELMTYTVLHPPSSGRDEGRLQPVGEEGCHLDPGSEEQLMTYRVALSFFWP
jgi:hypothetical protein